MGKLRSLLELPGTHGSGRFPSMEGLRGYAAGLIFLLHYNSVLAPRFGIDLATLERPKTAAEWVAKTLDSGEYGVDIFFLLSGFLIAGMTAKPDFGYRRFIAHRFVRIYPALLASLALFVGYSTLIAGRPLWPGGIVMSLFLLNGVPGFEHWSISVVTWSLFFEVAFYLLFPLLFLARQGSNLQRLRFATLAAMTAIVPLALLVHPNYARFAMFLVGAWLRLLPEAKRAGLRAPFPEPVAIAIYLAATGLFIFSDDWRVLIVLFAFPAYLLVDRTLHGRGALCALFSATPLRLFGNISYSFYLLHVLGIHLANDLLRSMMVPTGLAYAALLLILGLAFSLTLAVASFVALERPYFLLRPRFDRMITHFCGRRKKLA